MSKKNNRKAATLARLSLLIVVANITFCGGQNSQQQRQKLGGKPITPLKEYTAENPREWAGMEEELVPKITFNKGFGQDIIIRVNLKNPSPSNYIEKIGIVDNDGKEIVVKPFSPHEKFFEAHFFSSDLPFNKSGLKVFSKSSLYDLWTTPLPKQF